MAVSTKGGDISSDVRARDVHSSGLAYGQPIANRGSRQGTTRLPSNRRVGVTSRGPMTHPQHSIATVTQTLGLWVASSAEAVTAVLTSDLCRVRAPAEPVPRALLGSPAADIFRQLVRMNDGPGPHSFKPTVSRTLEAVDG